ncbi:MAG: alpha/beta hydrolase [Candidatus Rokubacteria bacterium]|nr:alpha/beta hydrolase [Candidatus Rokubacteria bacterium]
MGAHRADAFEADMRPAAVPLWREGLTAFDWLSLHTAPVYYGLGVPRGAGEGVVVVPGFLGTDGYLRELFWWLRRIAYRPFLSRIGRNADCLEVLAERLTRTIEAAHRDAGGPVHLIGHSLGGMLAMSVAAARPELIASVATLGSPIRGIRSHPLVLRASEVVRNRIRRSRGAAERPDCFTGRCECRAVARFRAGLPVSMPRIAVYTRTDGIVDWRYCLSGDPGTDHEVPGTHIGLVWNAGVYRLIAAHLARCRDPG